MTSHTLSVLVENTPGVLARVSSLFMRRGFNIDSLAVGPTDDPSIARFTLTVDGAAHPIRPATSRSGSTPWATGLAVAGFTAVFVTMGDVVLSRAFADAFGLLWVPANLLVGIGLAPSLYLLRSIPFWRWPAFGTALSMASENAEPPTWCSMACFHQASGSWQKRCTS